MKRSSFKIYPAAKTQMRLSTRYIVTGVALIVIVVSIGTFIFLNLGNSHDAMAAPPTTISGIINSYARITAMPSSNRFTITNVTTCATCGSVASEFGAGKKVLIIQMKGAAINTSNSAAYGTVTYPTQAGNFELATIASITGSGPYTVTLTTSVINSYAVGGYMQMVTDPQYTDAIVGASGVTALDWNRTTGTGGIVVMEVSNTLSLSGNVNVSGKGFVGGTPNIQSNNTAAAACINSVTYRGGSTLEFAQKGEGIADYVSGSEYARGALANGGGGGNTHNAGGGGGSNLAAGGTGGQGWIGAGACGGSSTNGGGLGGFALTYSSTSKQIFMGGGGGGGQQNNSLATRGGNGGGIIIIRAGTIAAACPSTFGFYANGNNAANTAGNDGAGGGGGGGAIMLEALSYSFPCQVNANANGGKGGNVTTGEAHGGGGGGGVGAVLVKSTASLPANANFTSVVGANGLDCTTCTLSSSVPGGSCPSGMCSLSAWSVDGVITTLPIRLISFTAQNTAKGVELKWVTAQEENNAYFTIEKSVDAAIFTALQKVKGAGNSSEKLAYQAIDQNKVAGLIYYRLRQTDIDGKSTVSKIVSVNNDASDAARTSNNGSTTDQAMTETASLTVNKVGPNPFLQDFFVDFDLTSEGLVAIQLTDMQGRVVETKTLDGVEGNNRYEFVDSQGLKPGIYVFSMKHRNSSKVIRLMKR